MTTAPFDFAALDLASACDAPHEFELKHPQTEDGLGVFVSVVGVESATFQAYVRAEGNKARRKQFKGRGASEPVTIEDEEDSLLRAVVACMTGWRTVIDGKSEPVIYIAGDAKQFTETNAVAWLKQFRWAAQQINAATADLGNFMKG
jgi:hypothetical protein